MAQAAPSEPEELPPPRRWGGGDVAWGFAAGLVGSSVVTSIYRSLVTHATDLGLAYCGFIGLWIGWLGVPIYASLRKGSGSLSVDFGLRFDLRRDLPLGLALGVAGQLLVFLIFLPVQIFDPHLAKSISKPAENLSDLASGWGSIPFDMAICLGAPFVEELFFRGLTMRSFINRWGPVAGVTVTSLLFGIAHLEGIQTLALVGFGAILGTSAFKTGRLGPNMIAHATFNTISLIALAH